MEQFKLSEGTAARRRVFLHLVDATDGITPETGEAAGQPQISKNGAAFGNTSATLTSVGNGLYYVELTSGELDTLGRISVRYKSANTAEFQTLAQVIAFDPYDAVRAGLTALPNANAEASGGLYTRGSGAGQINQDANGRSDARVAAMSSTERDALLYVLSGTPTATSGSTTTLADTVNLTQSQTDHWKGMILYFRSGSNAGISRRITAFDPATDTITFSPAVPTAVSTDNYNILRGFTEVLVDAIKSGVVADANVQQWTSVPVDTPVGSWPTVYVSGMASGVRESILSAANGTAGSGSSTTLVDGGRAEAATDYWKGMILFMTTGANAGLARRISAFNPGTDTMTVSPAFPSAIGVGDQYFILRTSFAEMLVDAIKTDAVDAAALKADAVTEIQSGLALSTQVDAVESDLDDIQTRLPAALVGGRMASNAEVVGDKTGYALTSGERDTIAAALLNLADGIEAGYTVKQALRLIAAMTCKSSGDPGSPVFRNLGDTADRVSATIDAHGNRTSVTHTP